MSKVECASVWRVASLLMCCSSTGAVISAIAYGPNHTQCIENAFSLLKRGIYGSYHKVSIKHLQGYCNEFSYRFNRRGEQLRMFDGTLKNLLHGKALSYKRLISHSLTRDERVLSLCFGFLHLLIKVELVL